MVGIIGLYAYYPMIGFLIDVVIGFIPTDLATFNTMARSPTNGIIFFSVNESFVIKGFCVDVVATFA
jgi:hypothetical protein